MAEGAGAGLRWHSRVHWVAFRTLRQLPKVVGENSAGEPIVEIRSVRLVLRAGASHFSRVTACSKCGREVPGAPVLTSADLDEPPHPVICKDCVRTASAPVLGGDRRPARTEPADRREGGPRSDDDRLAVLERRMAELAALVDAQRSELARRAEEARVEVRSLTTKELARAQEDVDRMMKGVLERAGWATSGADAGGAQAVEAKLSRSIERLAQRVDEQRAELVADVDARLGQVQAAIEDQVGRPASQADELRATVEELARGQDDLRRRFEDLAGAAARDGGTGRVDAVEARVAQLDDRVAAEAARMRAELDERLDRLDERVQHVEELLADAAATDDRVVERLDRQAERARRAAGDSGRLEAVEQRLDEAVDRLAGLVEAQRLEFQEEVRAGLAEARMAMAADQRGGGRLRKLEEAAAQRDAQLAELMELQTTLDTGLGELRSEIEQLREAAAEASRFDMRVQETVEIPQLPAVEPERGRRGARKSADAVAQLTAAVQGLLNDHRVIRAQLATIENESETAVRASARASAQAGGFAPLRQDVRALRAEVAAQNQAVAALGERVEVLRRAVESPPPAKPATKVTKPAKSAKTTKTAKAAKVAKVAKKA